VNHLRTAAIVLLSATTAGVALLAWRQYGELVELRAQVMNRSERADLQKRIWELEKLNRDLPGRTAKARNEPSPEDSAAQPPDASRGGRSGDPRGRDGQMQQINALREMLAKPEVQAMIGLQQRGGIESRFAALFKNLNLSADQAAKLSALLAERGNTRQDLFAVAREQGIDPRTNPDAYRKLFADAQNEINAGIKSVIGETGFAQLQNYEQTMPQRAIVNELQQRLSYTSTPLTAAQSEQLIQILATNSPTRPADAGPAAPGLPPPRGPGFGPPGGGPGPDFGGVILSAISGRGGPGLPPEVIDGAMRVASAPVTPAAVAQAQTVLAPPQVAALQQIQQQQQAQQQLQQIIRETMPPRGDDRPLPPGNPSVPSPSRRPGG
jgi:hypothetical protein